MGKMPDSLQDEKNEFHENGAWTLPVTILKHEEEFEQAAIRTVLEETGIKVDYIRVACVNNDKTERGHFVTVGIVSDRWNGNPEIKNSKKILQWEWFSLEDSPFPISMLSAKILLNIRKGKFYFHN